MKNHSPTPRKSKTKSKFERQKTEFDKKIKDSITKEIEFEPPDFVMRSSFLGFVFSGTWRLPVAIAVATLIMTISITVWSNNIRSEWWIGPFFDSDFLQTDCIHIGTNIHDYMNVTIEDDPPSENLMELYTTDIIGMLRDEEVVDHIYGFNVTYGLVNGIDLNTPILLGTAETYSLMGYDMAEGDCAFDGDGEIPEIVLSGGEFVNFHVGDIITLTCNRELYGWGSAEGYLTAPTEYHPITVRVAGKTGFPYITQKREFHVTRGEPHIEGDPESKIFMLYSEKNMELLKESGFCVLFENEDHYVTYKADADQKAINDFRADIRNMINLNTYDFLQEPNIISTYELCRMETVFFAEKLPEIKRPVPKIIRLYLPPAPYLLSIFAAIILIVMIDLTFDRITSGYGIKGKNRISLADAVKTAIIIPILSAVIPFIVLINISSRYIVRSETSPPVLTQFFAMLISPHFIRCTIAMLVMVLIISLPAVLFSFRKFRSAVRSEKMTAESYICKEAEYYTEDSYTPNDFEMADYSALRNNNTSSQPEDLNYHGDDDPPQ